MLLQAHLRSIGSAKAAEQSLARAFAFSQDIVGYTANPRDSQPSVRPKGVHVIKRSEPKVEKLGRRVFDERRKILIVSNTRHGSKVVILAIG